MDLILQFSQALGEHIPKETFPRARTMVEKGQHCPGGDRRGRLSCLYGFHYTLTLSHCALGRHCLPTAAQ